MRKLRARERKKKGTGENSSVGWTKSERRFFGRKRKEGRSVKNTSLGRIWTGFLEVSGS